MAKRGDRGSPSAPSQKRRIVQTRCGCDARPAFGIAGFRISEKSEEAMPSAHTPPASANFPKSEIRQSKIA